MSLYGDGDGDDATTPRATAVEGGRLSLAELSETLSSGPLVRFPGVRPSDHRVHFRLKRFAFGAGLDRVSPFRFAES